MVHSDLQDRRSGSHVEHWKQAAQLGVAAGCAALPAVLMLLPATLLPPARGFDVVLIAILAIVLPSAIAIPTGLLWQARRRIRVLEHDRSTNQKTSGVDALTDLPDRACFERTLAAAAANKGGGTSWSLIAIDVDRFKSVNDTHGHLAGDHLLVEIVDRVRRVVREGDCFARIGGDEFALLMMHVPDAAHCAAVAQRIVDAMLTPCDLGCTQVFATLSLGVAIGPQDGETATKLSQAADLALYRAKHEGRNRFAFFDKSMEQKLRLGETIEDDLRRAIGNDEFSIAYQPLIDARTGRMHGVEALARWEHPTLGHVPPEDFIPLAESRGLIVPLGEWVLRRACIDARRWPGLRLAVNVSPVQFRQRGFVDRVASILAATGIEPSRVDLELTEGVLIQDAEQAETVIIDLRALGIRMGLDDFGSGYSSMIYLRRFAFDKVKIDRAFLQSLESSGEGAIILEYIVSLGHALGLSVTAEGVELAEQVEFLRKLGCDELQGYFFAPPMTAAEIDQRVSLDTWSSGFPAPAIPLPDCDAA